jgi:hypothetical protein
MLNPGCSSLHGCPKINAKATGDRFKKRIRSCPAPLKQHEAFAPDESRGDDADPGRRPRARFLAHEIFNIAVQRCQERHQTFNRETIKLVVLQRRYLGLAHFEQTGRRRMGVIAFLKDYICLGAERCPLTSDDAR